MRFLLGMVHVGATFRRPCVGMKRLGHGGAVSLQDNYRFSVQYLTRHVGRIANTASAVGAGVCLTSLMFDISRDAGEVFAEFFFRHRFVIGPVVDDRY